jgi:hypothetical protein
MLDPDNWRFIDWPADQTPMLVIVVDTEAEFDWRSDRPRKAMGVSSVRCQHRTQRIFEKYGVRPTFVLDYPVSSTPEAYEIIRDLHRSGACEIGSHLQTGTTRRWSSRSPTRIHIRGTCLSNLNEKSWFN